MCAIKPTHKRRFVIDVYTSHDITEEAFLDIVTTALLEAEVQLNAKGNLRFHLKTSQQEAD